MFFSVYEAIGWVYYKQEGEPQADGTEETAGLRKGCQTLVLRSVKLAFTLGLSLCGKQFDDWLLEHQKPWSHKFPTVYMSLRGRISVKSSH